jgi:hypothetical protein
MTMAASVRCRYQRAQPPAKSVSAEIAAFLDGTTNGEKPLHALYDHVLDEVVPPSIRRLLEEPQRRAV